MASSRPVRALLALPAWRWWVVGSFVARLPATMVIIALVLAGKRFGSYGLGAALAGLYTIASGLSALWRGRALDKRELRSGIVAQLIAGAAAFGAPAILVQVRAPLPLVGGTVIAAGVASSAVMAGYRSFLPDVVGAVPADPPGPPAPDLIQPAYALDAVLLEVGFVTGLALAGGLALLVGPVGVLWAMSGFGLVAAGVARARLPERHPATTAGGDAPPPWTDRFVVANYAVTFAVGVLIGVLEAGFAPYAVLLGAEDGVGGLCSAAYALGSGLGGVGFATRLGGRSDHGRVALVLVVALGLLVVPVAVAPSIPLLLVLLVLAGLPFATANAAAASHLQARVHRARATEGFALVTTAVLLGVGVGSGLASIVLAAEASPRLLYLLGALPPLLAVAAVAVWAARVHPPGGSGG